MNIHILVITGAMTAPLALALRQQGHIVTGSDQDRTYPPFSTQLENSKIPVNQTEISKNIDLCIVGSGYLHFNKTRDEFEQIKKLGIPYISATEYLAKNLIKQNSILVAGAYGKTTISSILAYLMPESNYFFGGEAVNNLPSLNFSKSNWSIVEADESINGLDNQAKFLYYPVKYLILTSINWEHKDSYKTADDNFQAFKRLVENIPSDGALIYNPSDQTIQNLLPFCKAKAIPYKNKTFDSNLIGQHNQQNLSAAYTLCNYLNIEFNISDYLGVKRRLEIVSNKNNILFIDDFAQSADRVLSSLKAISQTYPDRNIYVYFEPHASFLQHNQSLSGFELIEPYIKQFVLSKIKYTQEKVNRVTALNWKQILGEKLIYIPINQNIINYFDEILQPNDILIHFSSGGLEGLNTLKTVYNNI